MMTIWHLAFFYFDASAARPTFSEKHQQPEAVMHIFGTKTAPIPLERAILHELFGIVDDFYGASYSQNKAN